MATRHEGGLRRGVGLRALASILFINLAMAVFISLATDGGYMMAADRAQTLFRNQQQLHRVAGCLYVLVAVGLLLSIFNVI